ncbi:MAG: DUF1345 domain-containing protein [Actinobacteria bacterium]|nr:DUF1345 domain-containing protein [Actinomycetota bacterium]
MTGMDPAQPSNMDAAQSRNSVWYALLNRAERAAVREAGHIHLPAWQRSTPGEGRWPVTASLVVAIVLQLLLPGQLRLLPRYLLPALEAALLIGLIAADPVRIESRSRMIRLATIALIFLISGANAASAVVLVRDIVIGAPGVAAGGHGAATRLLASGGAVWVTNVIAFSLWYWEFDRGGPVHRANGTFRFADLMFPQMASPELAPPDWEPRFTDYLYLSFTNATAFSPTDVMPLARWAKLTMLVQSAVSLAVGVLVIARAVNILR